MAERKEWRPEAVVFCGVQAAGKSTFYRERFFETHVRINMDMLKTRRRETLLLEACLLGRQPFVADNTNVLAADRARYIGPARAAGFRVSGYFFRATPREAIARNKARSDKPSIPIPGLLGTYKRLEEPRWSEGFDALYTVTLTAAGIYLVEPAPPDPPPI
ncbi:AAA family ATPase [Longimicrobium sp.]|uniref:AAA family ATPase n=1 Tax=Longimicrobium sp. TaxID=2029185 RepID=UPI002C311439|nr:AAA family ATPase [Longimicrobium sp.]HSU17140.1 AAA family ATPase [Longimicrobium sp.]